MFYSIMGTAILPHSELLYEHYGRVWACSVTRGQHTSDFILFNLVDVFALLIVTTCLVKYEMRTAFSIFIPHLSVGLTY